MTGHLRSDARKRLAETTSAPTLVQLAAANDAAREAHEAARSYAVATEAAYDATRSALAVAIAALHEEK